MIAKLKRREFILLRRDRVAARSARAAAGDAVVGFLNSQTPDG
jgi:hypothetical protein